MFLNFYKYQGTGNDFILIDDRKLSFDETQEALVAHLCHRRFGIGADGLILLRPSDTTDFSMVYFNADGRQSSMCGNGGRCIVSFANYLGVIQSKTTFEAIDGLHEAELLAHQMVALKMTEVTTIEHGEDFYFLHTGSPHYVRKVTQLQTYPVTMEGKKIRYQSPYVERGGTNVNFVEVLANQSLFVRTYERGVEDETYSCGTGVTAAALAHHLSTNSNVAKQTTHIQTLGGDLAVSFEKKDNTYQNIFLQGAAQLVFEGKINL